MHPETGEILAAAGETISRELADQIQRAGVNCVVLHTENERGSFDIKVIGNNFADASAFLNFDPAGVGITEKVRSPTLKRLIEEKSR